MLTNVGGSIFMALSYNLHGGTQKENRAIFVQINRTQCWIRHYWPPLYKQVNWADYRQGAAWMHLSSISIKFVMNSAERRKWSSSYKLENTHYRHGAGVAQSIQRLATGLDDRVIGVRGLIGSRIFSFSILHVVQTVSEAHPTSYPIGTGGSFPRG
jgi:hypothetical protein